MKNILVVDDDPRALYTFAGLLKSQSNFLRIFPAVGIQAAIQILADEDVHLIITGMHMSEIYAFKLSLLVFNDPGISVIVMTDKASSMFHTKIKEMATIIHFDQVLDISVLVKRIFTTLQIDFGGQIRGVTLSSLLQILELEGRSCTLMVTAKAKTGILHVVGGQPVAARMESLVGKFAAQHILNWQNVLIDIDYNAKDVPREITTSLMELLLESGRMSDETLSQRHNLRNHKRYDCLVGAGYQIRNWKYQCYMRDLSEGGAYIETEQPVETGQLLLISLYSPMLSQYCDLSAKVLRRDSKGIGVRFEGLTKEQKNLIRAVIESSCSPIVKSSKKMT